MNRSFACALLLAAGLAAQALPQTPTLVRDINPGTGSPGAPGSHPRQFTTVAERVVFTALGEDSAYRLWATDGTAAGTEVLAIFCVAQFSCREPRRMGELPGLAFFVASSPEDLFGLPQVWRTDGTRAGTFPVSPPLVLGDSGFPVVTAALGRRLLFSACDDTSGNNCALWSTDGTAAGTGRVLDKVLAFRLTSNGRRAVFSGRDATGIGVWATDGTAAGTELVLRGDSAFLTTSGSKIFFMAGGEFYPTDLWVSDGTKRGSQVIARFGEPFHRLPPNTTYLKPVPGGVIFVASKPGSGLNLWRSDGTRQGTRALTAFQDSSAQSVQTVRADQIAVVRDRVLFIATGTAGPRLWTSRGSPRTTGPVTGCAAPGCPALVPGTPLALAGGRVVFAARDAAHGVEPWTSDGTGPGTRLLRDLCPGPCGSSPDALTSHNGITDFQATWNGRTRMVRTDGVTAVILATVTALPPSNPYLYSPRLIDLADLGGRTFFAGLDPLQGEQPWVTDGTRAGTRQIAAIEGGGSSSNPRDFTVLGDRLLFVASDGVERSVWTVTTPAGTAAAPLAGTGVPEGRPGPSQVTVSGAFAFFMIDRGPDEEMELWRTDGTPAGTVRLASFQDQALSELRDMGGKLLFLVTSTIGEQPVYSFWGSDGTPAGTGKRFDLPTDTVGVGNVTALGSELYFVLHREGGAQIFRSDGTAAGTRSIFELPCDCIGDPISFVRFVGSVYFTASGSFGPTLYRTDGTAAGTVRVLPAPGDPAFRAGGAQALFEFQGELYFFASNPDQNSSTVRVLWKIGPTGDPVLIKTIGFSYFDPVDPQFTVLGERLYFRAWDPEHGFELWRTDGTAAGTVLVADVEPGPFSSDPQGLVAAGGRLWFSALDRVHGRELWTSDGTPAGTRLVADLAAGGVSSSPEELTPFAGRLYFSADDQVVGREPWSVGINP
ncbi:MAG TPA: ELWxxDGT repeat protein [Thermoanaerobaculia bacterium]|nr:ELWxxDGT repeat protein [Thermoanaerobaculia bacterium]